MNIEEIPVIENTVVAVPICPPFASKSYTIGVYARGDWITSSIEIIAFSNFLTISNEWLFPAPLLVNVTAIPADAYSGLVAILNFSLLTLIA